MLKPSTKGIYFKLPEEWEEFKKMIPIIDKLVGKLDQQQQQQQQQQPKKPYFIKRQNNQNNGTLEYSTTSTPKRRKTNLYQKPSTFYTCHEGFDEPDLLCIEENTV